MPLDCVLSGRTNLASESDDPEIKNCVAGDAGAERLKCGAVPRRMMSMAFNHVGCYF